MTGALTRELLRHAPRAVEIPVRGECLALHGHHRAPRRPRAAKHSLPHKPASRSPQLRNEGKHSVLPEKEVREGEGAFASTRGRMRSPKHANACRSNASA